MHAKQTTYHSMMHCDSVSLSSLHLSCLQYVIMSELRIMSMQTTNDETTATTKRTGHPNSESLVQSTLSSWLCPPMRLQLARAQQDPLPLSV